jgi:hypothetical protein
VDVSLTHQQSTSPFAIQETWLTPHRQSQTPGFSFIDCWVRIEVGSSHGTGSWIKHDVMGCVMQLRCLKGQKFDQATWVPIEEQVEQNSLVSAATTLYFDAS